jgi:hypothetical protein
VAAEPPGAQPNGTSAGSGAVAAEDDPHSRPGGIDTIGTLTAEFQRAGVPVTLRQRGEPRPLSATAEQAAYRVVEEGLTNAAKHAPGQPITVSVDWEPDTLLLAVANPVPGDPATLTGLAAGHGLIGLRERVRPAGGFLDHARSDGSFRLVAMLPCDASSALPRDAEEFAVRLDDLSSVGRSRAVALGFAVAVVMFVILPASMLLGVG